MSKRNFAPGVEDQLVALLNEWREQIESMVEHREADSAQYVEKYEEVEDGYDKILDFIEALF